MKKKAGYMSFRFFTYSEKFILIILLLLILTGCGGSGASAPPAPAYIVNGKITYNGVGTSGVVVTLSQSDVSFTTTTDADGIYIVKTVPNGTYSISSADSRYGFVQTTVTVNGAPITVPDIIAYPGYRVTGKIALTSGTPVGGVNVRLYTSGFSLYSTTVNGNTFYGTKNLNGIESVKNNAILQTVTTNNQGEFVFHGVRSGTYTIEPISGTHLFRWPLAPSLDYIGVVTLTESGMAYLYNPEADWNSNKLSADGTIIYNTVEPITVIANTLNGQNFEAAVPGDVGINW